MKVINLIGGANTGKSTTAYGLINRMKQLGYSVEYVSEYAKELAYDGHTRLLADQLAILAEQSQRLKRLEGKIDYVVMDTSLLLGLVYAVKPTEAFKAIVWDTFYQYDNLIYHLPRNEELPFHGAERVQKSHAEAAAFDQKIMDVLYDVKVPVHYLPPGTSHLWVNLILNGVTQ